MNIKPPAMSPQCSTNGDARLDQSVNKFYLYLTSHAKDKRNVLPL